MKHQVSLVNGFVMVNGVVTCAYFSFLTAPQTMEVVHGYVNTPHWQSCNSLSTKKYQRRETCTVVHKPLEYQVWALYVHSSYLSNLPHRITCNKASVRHIHSNYFEQRHLTWYEITGHSYPVMCWSRRKAGRRKETDTQPLFFVSGKSSLVTEAVRKERPCRAGGCIKEKKTVRPHSSTLARLGSHTLKVEPFTDSLACLSLGTQLNCCSPV